jgi:hypothetical protein
MASNALFYQLLFAALVLVCLIIHVWWLDPLRAAPPPPVEPLKPRRKRSQIPADYVVTSPPSRNLLDVSTCYPHYVSSAPTDEQTEMRHATGRQTQTPKSHSHRRFPR